MFAASVILNSRLLVKVMVYGSPPRKRSLYWVLPDTCPSDRLTRPSSTTGKVRFVWLRLVLSACSNTL
ncbi:hypothetical protein D3C80_1426370 [compost metagenome]